MRFQNKNIIITGAANGIGKAAAIRIASEGGNLALLDLNLEKLLIVANDIKKRFANKVHIEQCDVADFDATGHAITQAAQALGGIHALSHNAGILRTYHTHEMTVQQWNEIMSVNATGTFNVNRHALPFLLKNKVSYLVNTASNAADHRHPWLAAYAASKGAIKSFTRSLFIEYALQGLRANCVLPGNIATELSSTFKIPLGGNKDLIKTLIPLGESHPVGTEHVASVIAFLACDDAFHINGTEITVDGGKLF